MSAETKPSTHRQAGIDVARGALIVAMVLVHVISAHGAASQVNWLHTWIGVFLISSGFVAISGFVIGAKPGVPTPGDGARALDAFVHLLVVMLGYGIVLSLFRQQLTRLAGGTEACAARYPWSPPLRFDDLGILLPIAIVQLLGPLARLRHRWTVPLVCLLALGWMLLPAATAAHESSGAGGFILGALTRRTLTPFYTVSTFVALGLLGSLLGRLWPALRAGEPAPAVSLIALVAAIALAVPAVSRAVIDPAYRVGGELGGATATLVYWTITIATLIRGFAAPLGRGPSLVRHALALIGRNSLVAFILHDFLLELDVFARSLGGVGKSLGAAIAITVANVALVVLVCAFVERSARARPVVAALLLNRARSASRRFTAFGAAGLFALVVIFAAYTSLALVRPEKELLIDDFDGPRECPVWWSFGNLQYSRAAAGTTPSNRGQVLAVRGSAPGAFASGRGTFVDRDIGPRRTLKLDVRGYGPHSGRIKIELSEDDNGNWEIEKDPRLFTPLYDDRFIYELTVDWSGWRELSLPISQFHDDNPNGGNNQFDPARDLTSGGLLEMQLLFGPGTPDQSDIRIDLDNIRWTI